MIVYLYRANWVNGIKYQEPCALLIGQQEDNLKFGKVTQIYVDGKEVLFEVELYIAYNCVLYSLSCIFFVISKANKLYQAMSFVGLSSLWLVPFTLYTF